jgi:hypothetical protein
MMGAERVYGAIRITLATVGRYRELVPCVLSA